jgi:hypothetical protein
LSLKHSKVKRRLLISWYWRRVLSRPAEYEYDLLQKSPTSNPRYTALRWMNCSFSLTLYSSVLIVWMLGYFENVFDYQPRLNITVEPIQAEPCV